MAFLPDEEAYSVGARTLIKHGVKADVSVMTEPGFGQIYVGGPGKMLVKAVAKGKACHGARPEEGINAVVELAKLIAVLDKIPLHDDGEMGPQQYVPFSIKGGPDHYSLSVPQDCYCFISKQLVPGETKEEVFANLEEAVRGLNIQGSITFELSKPFYMPYRVDETSADFKLFEEVCQKELGCVPPYAIEPSVSDSNCLSGEAGIPVIMFGADGHGKPPGERIRRRLLHRRRRPRLPRLHAQLSSLTKTGAEGRVLRAFHPSAFRKRTPHQACALLL